MSTRTSSNQTDKTDNVFEPFDMDDTDSHGMEVDYPQPIMIKTARTHQERPPYQQPVGNDSRDASPSDSTTYNGPVDLDDLFNSNRNLAEYAARNDDNDSLFGGDEDDHDDDSDTDDDDKPVRRYYNNPHKRLLDNDASLIPGSPFSKPANKASNRPSEPLAIAKYASTCAFLVTFGWVVFLLFNAIWNYNNIGRILIECVLALLSFFGLFWNSYFLVSSIFKCFIPAKALKSNTKYCSIIPETKPPEAAWLEVTIQIPVYKESLHEVLMPTLKSCIAAREHYISNSGGCRCNIVICDDGMMNFLRDNFPAAEMLWENIIETQGQVIRLSKLLKHVPRASRRHLKGLRSKNVYEVFHRMLFYYHYNIGFVARSTVDRRGKFKKASNLNSHLRLALGAAQLAADSEQDISFEDALLRESHNDDGSRFVMFGNDIRLGHLICINDADARMSESVIIKTVPEFLNDKTLGFTQHVTKTMNEQRGESYYTNLLTVYTDALYQGHFLLSSILGCHPPLVGHSIFLRTEAVNQVGKMRTLRKAQQWLKNIGLQFLPVDQVGFSNLQAQNRLEYWSECHVSEDFELMIHLYNLGFNGRYCAYPDCEFQEGITRTFDEEAGRHRKFALGAHELVFNPFQDMLGRGIFTPLFRTFLTCDIPSYYKIFLTAYLCSYTSGGAYIIVFTAAAVTRILDQSDEIGTLQAFSPAGIIILNFAIYYIVGYFTFLVSILRMHYINNKLLFPEYRKKWFGALYIVYVHLRYSLVFQFLFYNVTCFTFYFLGSMDHLLAKPGIVGATNKDSISISRCTAFYDMARFNSGSFAIALVIGGLAYITVLQDLDWDYTAMPTREQFINHGLFAGPALFISLMCFIVPIILNPWILGWPFLRQHRKPQEITSSVPSVKRTGSPSARNVYYPNESQKPVVGLNKFMTAELNNAIERAATKPDVELGSLATKELGSTGTGQHASMDARKHAVAAANAKHKKAREDEYLRAQGIAVGGNKPNPNHTRRDSRGGSIGNGNYSNNFGKSSNHNNGFRGAV